MFLFEAVMRKIFGGDSAAPIKCVASGNKGDYVILIHGLYKLPFSLMKITKALNQNGYCVLEFEYESRKDSIDQVATSKLPKFIKQYCIDPKKKINFVTHSAGGIVLRRYLDKNKLLQLGRTVMIAPPNHGSDLADFFMTYMNSIYKFLCGPIGQRLGTSKNDYVHKILPQKANFDLGIIAGQGSLSPLSWFIMKGLNDGMVSIESTKLKDMKDHIVIPAPHSIILFFDFTTKKVLDFIKTGMF